MTEDSNPFLFDQDVGDNIQEALDRLLLFPHDERLVTLARESAKNLHSFIPVEERREKINSTVSKLLLPLHKCLKQNKKYHVNYILECYIIFS